MFKKLSSLLDKPLVRILQAGSKDDVSVAQYYSSKLVLYVREVRFHAYICENIFVYKCKCVNAYVHDSIHMCSHALSLLHTHTQVLHVIPESVFNILDVIIKLQTTNMKALPTKIERKHLKDFAQLEQRHTLAKATHQVTSECSL
jgi:WASH complex subunit strumpellin